LALSPGSRLGPYEITAQIGVGGMGEVYRAIDTTLKRLVAIKILPPAVAGDVDRLARFQREAEVLASLNHPNIAAIYGMEESEGVKALAMELVEGDDLSQRVARRAIPIDEALPIARQIAVALEAAHEQDIVHRDLKPANIKVRHDGTVKVLDFGLAKALGATGGSRTPVSLASSPTITAPAMMTEVGILLGTAAYMSPEQARGHAVDKRSDIWAFGCVFYEMLTGRQAFASENLSDTVAAVLRSEPDWHALPADTPARIRVLLKRCLQKDLRQRLHDVADARIEIEDRNADATPAAASPRQTGVHRVTWVVLSLVSGAALASGLWWVGTRPLSATPAPVHLSLILANKAASFVHMNASRELAISPDGQKIVYVALHNGKRQLFLRALGDPEGKPVDGTDGALTAFFSPDSEWIAFGKGSALQKAAVSGGSPITICNLSGTGFYGGDWGADDTIVFVPDYNGGLWTVSANGGTPQPLLKTDVEKDRVSYSDPQMLPGGKSVLFTLASGHAVTADDQDVAVLDPGGKDPRILIRGASHPRYLPTGQVVYVHAGALLAVTFDVSKLVVTGTPVSMIEGLGKTWSGDTDYSISNNGTVVYEADAGVKTGGLFVLVDRKGNVKPVSTKRGNYSEFSISPNGRSLASRIFAINDDIWTYDIASGAPLRFTFEPRDEIFPQWTADGARIAYGTRTGTIFWKSADGSGSREELTHGAYPRYPASFSRDGKYMAFVEIHPSRRSDIWLMPLDGDRQPAPLTATDADERDARFSPDGQWLAYVSDETGRDEVFIRPIGTRGGRKQLSSDGGTGPAWASNGRELFFAKGDQLSAVTLDGQGNPVGRDRVLFSAPRFEDLQFDSENPRFDVMPDGEHFVFLLEPSSAPTRYNVVLHWFEELKARVRPK
jgi:serine/threonine protein kinase/Tol biopolymer transport system component